MGSSYTCVPSTKYWIFPFPIVTFVTTFTECANDPTFIQLFALFTT